MDIIVETAARNDDRVFVFRQCSDAFLKFRRGIIAHRSAEQRTGNHRSGFDPFLIVAAYGFFSAGTPECLLLFPEGFHAGGDNLIFRLTHLPHLIKAEIQKLFERKLFIDRVCAVQCAAVCSLHA